MGGVGLGGGGLDGGGGLPPQKAGFGLPWLLQMVCLIQENYSGTIVEKERGPKIQYRQVNTVDLQCM